MPSNSQSSSTFVIIGGSIVTIIIAVLIHLLRQVGGEDAEAVSNLLFMGAVVIMVGVIAWAGFSGPSQPLPADGQSGGGDIGMPMDNKTDAYGDSDGGGD